MRDLDLLPKAHLHLHFTGSLTPASLRVLAAREGLDVPDPLLDDIAVDVPFDKRGWFRFQRLYDAARRAVRSADALRFVVDRAAAEDAADGSRRLELQVDPTSYAPFVGGLQAALEIITDAAATASARHGLSLGIIVAASRLKHPLDARTLARLAARFAGDGPGQVVGFGLSNNERLGDTSQWEGAFRIARNAGLRGVPHGGELLGPDHVRVVLERLGPTRIGHGVRAAEDPALVERIAAAGIALEVCPTSNVHLGVFRDLRSVPVRQLMDAGVRVALSADDPLLFLSRLTDQYRVLRETHGFSDADLASLAAASIDASFAAEADKVRWRDEVAAWLAGPDPDPRD